MYEVYAIKYAHHARRAAGLAMTELAKSFEPAAIEAHWGPLWAQPADIARGILRALAARRDVVYLPSFWRAIMLVIRLLPERVFKRLTL